MVKPDTTAARLSGPGWSRGISRCWNGLPTHIGPSSDIGGVDPTPSLAGGLESDACEKGLLSLDSGEGSGTY